VDYTIAVARGDIKTIVPAQALPFPVMSVPQTVSVPAHSFRFSAGMA